ncbi:MAG: deoxyguanosinetriphosphate triphosphohydrolase [Oscillospiraceae bacterium]|nr:deoxyguanosinetriphosphate triphosphohydrolase [Oscillospiraceae bacterium]
MYSRSERGYPEPEDGLRTPFQRDTDRIVHSKSFRRLMHKTQMFLMPAGDHYRTRLTHAIEVSRIARTMARGLGLDEDLTEAISLGHDLGHAPFGHAGERVLNEIVPGGFAHNEQSLRLVCKLEKEGQGLNLCQGTRDGILNHSGNLTPATPEGKLVHIADRIAYLSHDMDDAVRGGLLKLEDVPLELRQDLGDTPKERINTFVRDAVQTGTDGENAGLSPKREHAMNELREFMFERVYRDPVAKSEEVKLQDLISRLYEHYLNHFDSVPDETARIAQTDGRERAVCDYIAGMTDRFFYRQCVALFIPKGWNN